MRMVRRLIPGFLILPLLGCAEAPWLAACPDDAKPCLQRLIEDHPTRRMAFWKDFFAKPVEARIFIAPPQVIGYLAPDNRKNGFTKHDRQRFLGALEDADQRGRRRPAG